MALTLTPNTEALVRSVAELRGQDPEEALIILLNQALAEADEKMAAELRASVEGHAAGRSIAIEEYRAEAIIRRQQRDELHPTINTTIVTAA